MATPTTPSYYSIYAAHGDELTTGIQSDVVARRAAQRAADRLGQSVFLSGPDADDEEIAPSTDPAPTHATEEVRS